MSSERVINSASVIVGEGSRANGHAGLRVEDLVYRARADFGWHHHPYSSLFVILSGGVREQSRREAVECPAGTIGFIPAGAEHRSVFAGSPVHSLNVVFDEAWLAGARGEGVRRLEPASVHNAAVSAAAYRLHAACRRADASRTLATEELVLELLRWALEPGRAGELGGVSARGVRAAGWLGAVVDRLRAAGNEEIGLRDVSEASGRHPAHVCREFRSAYGCSLSEYAQLVRVERACTMLRATDRGLAAVALSAGFYDQAHFTRVFRRVLGVTPRAYRRSFGREVE